MALTQSPPTPQAQSTHKHNHSRSRSRGKSPMAWRRRAFHAWRAVRQTQAATKDSMEIYGGITGAILGGGLAWDSFSYHTACPVGIVTRASIIVPVTITAGCVYGSLLFRAWPVTVPAVVVASGLYMWAERRTSHA